MSKTLLLITHEGEMSFEFWRLDSATGGSPMFEFDVRFWDEPYFQRKHQSFNALCDDLKAYFKTDFKKQNAEAGADLDCDWYDDIIDNWKAAHASGAMQRRMNRRMKL